MLEIFVSWGDSVAVFPLRVRSHRNWPFWPDWQLAHFCKVQRQSEGSSIAVQASFDMGNCSTRSKNYGSTTVELKNADIADVYASTLHDGPILGAAYAASRSKILTCSDDQRIAISDIKSLCSASIYNPVYLVGHKKAVNKVISCGDQVWSTSRDLTVKLVRNKLYALSGHLIYTYLIKSDLNLLCSYSGTSTRGNAHWTFEKLTS